MYEYERLKKILDEKISELTSLSDHVVTSSGVDAVRDTVGERIEYDTYTDLSRATQLMTEIEQIKKELEEFPILNTKLSKKQEDVIKKSVVWDLMKYSKVSYEEEMKEYMKLNFWGKAKTMFAGKRPKKNATDNEIIDKYGEDAKETTMLSELNRYKREHNQIIEWIKEFYKNHPEELKTTIEERIEAENKDYEERLKEVYKRNDEYLAEAKEVIREGKVKL